MDNINTPSVHEILHCVFADEGTERVIYLKVSGETHYLGLTAQKLKAAHPVDFFFPDFWAKILKIARPVNYSYLPPWNTAIPIPDYIQRQTTSNTQQYHPAKVSVMKANNHVYKYSFFPCTILTNSHQMFLIPKVLKASKQLFQMTFNLLSICNSVSVFECIF